MNKLYAAWLNREAKERFGVTACQLTEEQRDLIEGGDAA